MKDHTLSLKDLGGIGLTPEQQERIYSKWIVYIRYTNYPNAIIARTVRNLINTREPEESARTFPNYKGEYFIAACNNKEEVYKLITNIKKYPGEYGISAVEFIAGLADEPIFLDNTDNGED